MVKGSFLDNFNGKKLKTPKQKPIIRNMSA